MQNHKLFKSLGAAICFVISLAAVYGLAAASRPATPPTTIQVNMYKLVEGGGAPIYVNDTPAACSITDNRDKWGCTAFYQPTNASTPLRATVVPYPYGSTAAPQISFENDYLKNVVPGEMEASIAPSVALQAQAIAARSYGWNKSGDLDNSTNRQLFVPYRFEYLRVEGGDTGHNPTTTPTPNVSNCASISSTGNTHYQRTVCDAIHATAGEYITASGVSTPAFAEFSKDAYLNTNAGGQSYLKAVTDTISYDGAIPTIVAQYNAHGHGMSQNGAMRWGHGNASRSGTGAAWSVKWDSPKQILTHYYTGIDLRDGSDTVLTPPRRWNWLQQQGIPDTLSMQDGAFVTLQIQNTGTEAWGNGAYSIWYRWCQTDGTSCADYASSADWAPNSPLYSDDPNAIQVNPGETIGEAYAYVWPDEALGTGAKRLVIDLCTSLEIGFRKKPEESMAQWQKRLRQAQKQFQRQQPQTTWECFGNQSPQWFTYQKDINITQ
ncbi:MAG: hypothetical protein HY741_23515 [Chloroflexi bacterium]|nr:hypothetical protein [Chloroflexota bacterium]